MSECVTLKMINCHILAQFFSPFWTESSRQNYVIFYITGLSAASKAADKSVGCFLAN
jgi:hypothetical protein